MSSGSLTLAVERPAVGGPMIARDGGRVVLVSGAIPGERVTARVDRVAKQVVFATATEVIEASPDRRPAFADPLCGGCIYSHIAYARQLQIKSEVIADAFARIGRLTLPAAVPVAASPEEGYRMRARLHARGGRIGFFREGTHDLCDARLTRQLLPSTGEVIDRLGQALRSFGGVVREIELSENVGASERVVHLETTEPLDRRAFESVTAIDGLTAAPYVTDEIAAAGQALRFRRHVRAFFQGNRYLLGDLVAQVASLVPAGSRVLDLYAGVGLFAVAAAALRGSTVWAVEADPHAADDLRANAAPFGAALTPVRDHVEAFLAERPPAPQVAIVDPPRTGLSAEALDALIALRAPRVIYVSCDVATLARDARRLVAAGYQIDRADAFDLFPNTPHVETVVLFDRGST